MKKTTLEKLLGGLVTISIPVVISVLSILILLSPVFMNLEYRLPNFPVDNFGFSTIDRLEFGNQTRRYLISNDTLGDLRVLEFDTGDPIYKESELKHLEDVKIVINSVIKVFWLAVTVVLVSGVFARSQDWRKGYIQSVARGGWLTAGLLGMILFLSIVSFQSLFTNFHRVFFEGDSWLFNYSDTLIRLFPMRFWQDVFIVFGVSTLAGGVLSGWLLPKLKWNDS
ncbi:MAG: TIGR01906 family membrane protein [Anaerolineales bacterium]